MEASNAKTDSPSPKLPGSREWPLPSPGLQGMQHLADVPDFTEILPPLRSPWSQAQPHPLDVPNLTEIPPPPPWRSPSQSRHSQQQQSEAEELSLIPPHSPRRSPSQSMDADAADKRPSWHREPLTTENLHMMDKMSRPSDAASTKSEPKSISRSSNRFSARANENAIFGPRRSKPPANLACLRSRLDKGRGSPPPSEPAYAAYVSGVECAENEQTMMYHTTQLLKDYDNDADYDYRTSLCQAFTAFPKDAGFNEGLSAPRPDMIQGYGMLSFKPFPVDEELGGAAVVVEYARNSVALSHLAGEFKARGLDMLQAQSLSAYDGAALVYGRNQALTYLGDTDPEKNATILSFSIDGAAMNIFAHYSSASEESGGLEYHQYPIFSTVLIGSYEEYITGRRRLRNAQDQAKYAAKNLRDRLKAHWKADYKTMRQLKEDWQSTQTFSGEDDKTSIYDDDDDAGGETLDS